MADSSQPHGSASHTPVLYRVESGVAMVTLNEPQRKNSLNGSLVAAFISVLKTLQALPDLRAIVLQAKGDTFCNGMDIESVVRSGDTLRRDTLLGILREYSHLLYLLSTISVPVMVVVRGAVRGGGVGIVSACDVVIATERASFELSELLFGVIPANVIPQLVQRLTPYRIRYMALTAQSLTAHHAHNYGLVDEVVAEEQLEKRLRQICRQFLRVAPSAVPFLKQSVTRNAWNHPEVVRSEAVSDALILITKPEVRDAMSSFLEGDTPHWYRKLSLEGALVEK